MEDIHIAEMKYDDIDIETVVKLLNRYIKYQTVNYNLIKASRLLKNKLIDKALVPKQKQKCLKSIDISFLDYALAEVVFEPDFDDLKSHSNNKKTFKVFLLESGILPIVDALTDVWANANKKQSPRQAYFALNQIYEMYNKGEQTYLTAFDELFTPKVRKKMALTIATMSNNKELVNMLDCSNTYQAKLKAEAQVCLLGSVSKFIQPLTHKLYGESHIYLGNEENKLEIV